MAHPSANETDDDECGDNRETGQAHGPARGVVLRGPIEAGAPRAVPAEHVRPTETATTPIIAGSMFTEALYRNVRDRTMTGRARHALGRAGSFACGCTQRNNGRVPTPRSSTWPCYLPMIPKRATDARNEIPVGVDR